MAIGLLVLATILTAVLSGGGGGGTNAPSQAEVVKALGLVPSPTGTWLTADGNCEIVSIDTGAEVTPGPVGTGVLMEVANEKRTVGAVVITHGTVLTETECADKVGAALRAHF